MSVWEDSPHPPGRIRGICGDGVQSALPLHPIGWSLLKAAIACDPTGHHGDIQSCGFTRGGETETQRGREAPSEVEVRAFLHLSVPVLRVLLQG